jgi:hypothetical protein
MDLGRLRGQAPARSDTRIGLPKIVSGGPSAADSLARPQLSRRLGHDRRAGAPAWRLEREPDRALEADEDLVVAGAHLDDAGAGLGDVVGDELTCLAVVQGDDALGVERVAPKAVGCRERRTVRRCRAAGAAGTLRRS